MGLRVEDIIEQVKLNIKPEQVCYFLDDPKLVNEINSLKEKGELSDELLKEKIIENQKNNKFDVEKLLLIIIYNYDEEIKELQRLLESDSKLHGHIGTSLKGMQVDSLKKVLNSQLNEKNKMKKIAQKLGEEINKVVVFYKYDDVNNKFCIDVVDSEEYIYGKKRGKNKIVKRFNKIDTQLKRIGFKKRNIRYVYGNYFFGL